MRDGRSGSLMQRIRLGKPFEERFGAPYRVCHRADLLSGLLSAAQTRPQIELNTGMRVSSAGTFGNQTELVFDDGTKIDGQAVIAADGINSALRPAVCGDVKTAARGHVIFRSLIPFNAVPPDIEADCVTLWLYPGGHVVHYPVSNWRNFNVVAAVDAPDAEDGLNQNVESRDVRAFFPDVVDQLTELLLAPLAWTKWQGADLPPLPYWFRDHLLLVGDAAHATLPYLAQGAAMALEDACELASCLKGNRNIAGAFANFENQRRPRAVRIQEESRKLGGIYHARGPVSLARNTYYETGGSRQGNAPPCLGLRMEAGRM